MINTVTRAGGAITPGVIRRHCCASHFVPAQQTPGATLNHHCWTLPAVHAGDKGRAESVTTFVLRYTLTPPYDSSSTSLSTLVGSLCKAFSNCDALRLDETTISRGQGVSDQWTFY